MDIQSQLDDAKQTYHATVAKIVATYVADTIATSTPAAPVKAVAATTPKANVPAKKTPTAKTAKPVAKKAATPKTAATAKHATGEKRSPEALQALTDKLGAYIAANPGQGVEEIGKALQAPTKTLNLPIKKLLAGKSIKTQGVKRSTRYFPSK